MNKLFLLLLVLLVIPSVTATTYLFDDFNRANSATVGNGWLETSGTTWSIFDNQLQINVTSINPTPTLNHSLALVPANFVWEFSVLAKQTNRDMNIELLQGTKRCVDLRLNSTSSFTYVNSGGVVVGAQIYSINTLYENSLKIYSGNKTFNWDINGVRRVTAGTFRDNTCTGVDKIRFSPAQTSSKYYVDDVCIADTSSECGTTGITVEVTNVYTGAPVFPVTVTFTNGSTKTNMTGNFLYFNFTNNNYTITTNASGYIPDITSFEHINATNVAVSLVLDNRLNIAFRNEETGNLINNVSFSLISSSFFQNYSTTTGMSSVSSIPANDYILNYGSLGYNARTYLFSVPLEGADDTNITLYLLNSSTSDTVQFLIKDRSNAQVIEGSTISMARYVGGQLSIVAVKSSDVTGNVEFDYEEGVLYEFTITKSGYDTKQFTLNPIVLSSYNVNLDPTEGTEDDGDYAGISIVRTSPTRFQNNQTHNVTYLFANPQGTFVAFGINVTWNGVTYNLSGSNAAGGYVTIPLLIENATFGEKVYIEVFYRKSGEDTVTFNYVFDVDGVDVGQYTLTDILSEDYGMGLITRILIVTLFALLMAGGAAYFAGTLPAGISGMLIFALFAYGGFISWWTVILPMLLLFLVVGWRSSQ